MTDFGIKETLQELGLKEINNGTSTGSNNFSSGEIIESYSPVDGKLIGKVKATSKEDYEKVMLKNFRIRRDKGEKIFKLAKKYGLDVFFNEDE